MSYLRDTAIILRREPFREHDDRLTLYGRTHGKLECVARASRKLEAKALGHLDPLMEVDVMIAKGSAFDKLAVARVRRPRLRLREQLSFLTVSAAVARLVAEWTRPGASDEGLYDLLEELLDLSEVPEFDPTKERSQLLFSAAALRVMDALGYGPRFDACAVCDIAIRETAFLSFEKGGVLCESCVERVMIKTERVSEPVLRLLSFMRREPFSRLMGVTALGSLFIETSRALDGFLERGALGKDHAAPGVALAAFLHS